MRPLAAVVPVCLPSCRQPRQIKCASGPAPICLVALVHADRLELAGRDSRKRTTATAGRAAVRAGVAVVLARKARGHAAGTTLGAATVVAGSSQGKRGTAAHSREESPGHFGVELVVCCCW